MKTIYSDDHHLHHAAGEFVFGDFVPAFEKPERADLVLGRLGEVALGPVLEPKTYPREKLTRVHSDAFVTFLETAYDQWEAAGRTGDVLPFSWRAARMRTDKVPTHIDGKLAVYSFDAGAPITKTSWQAIKSSADVALTGAELIEAGEKAVFSLCRPPGHHSGYDYFGGYCYINNAAVTAQHFLDNGAKRIAILDIDYHHGNGTQDIFYERSDVLFTSIHGDPNTEYPFLLGYDDEPGKGEGEGFNFNYPLPWGSDYKAWGAANDDACKHIEKYDPDFLIVSLGVDTFKDDPISQFKLENDDYLRIGERIAKIGKPTLFLMEGGYAVADIGVNAVNVLLGFEGRI